ncbi:DUF3099 domain-containing protein [Actinomadura sp. WAC 06369]|uniref:DUF3099 domain-containing protein n=1 Tax=Actinomadura sp. WAC 06369 TaxID=2203193 RepID=UPI002279BA35|nr:DUF3099 domain-containing protein [Actinomadura sp. WAC 06369]
MPVRLRFRTPRRAAASAPRAGPRPARDRRPPRPYREGMRGRRIAYAAMMGTCLTLFVLAWAVVRHFSVPAAIGMAVTAMIIPPFAAVVANWNVDREDDVHGRPDRRDDAHGDAHGDPRDGGHGDRRGGAA